MNKNAEYTHILGSWSPAAKAKGKHGAPMLMTQCVHPERQVEGVETTMSAPRAHPDLCVQNMLITQMLRLIQGRRGAYFCSNWSTAGNGHDLSLLAGLCVAGAIGAPYPFTDNAAARLDYDRLGSFMGVAAPPMSYPERIPAPVTPKAV